MRVRTPHAGSLRFPELRQSSQGESGPKPRLRSVGDGHAVHIRQPPIPSKPLHARESLGEVVNLAIARAGKEHSPEVCFNGTRGT